MKAIEVRGCTCTCSRGVHTWESERGLRCESEVNVVELRGCSCGVDTCLLGTVKAGE